jgi:hypothetical protein
MAVPIMDTPQDVTNLPTQTIDLNLRITGSGGVIRGNDKLGSS